MPLERFQETAGDFLVGPFGAGLGAGIGGIEVALVGLAGDQLAGLGKLEPLGYGSFRLDFHYGDLFGLCMN